MPLCLKGLHLKQHWDCEVESWRLVWHRLSNDGLFIHMLLQFVKHRQISEREQKEKQINKIFCYLFRMTVTWSPSSVISVNGVSLAYRVQRTTPDALQFWPWQLGPYLLCIQSVAQRYSIIHHMLLFGSLWHRQGGVWSDDGERKWWWNGIISLGIKNRSLNWIDLRQSPWFRSFSWSAAWLTLKL